MKKKFITLKALIDGTPFKVKLYKSGSDGRIAKEDVVNSVYSLCNDRYIKACEFPGYLRKLCKKFCRSVRGAKWEAKIIHGKKWSYKKFIKCVYQYCLAKYRTEGEWPANLKHLAKTFCGSIRQAKWEAKVIHDRRKRIRKRHRDYKGLWSKKKLLSWIQYHPAQKPMYWPTHIQHMCALQFGTCRAAKWESNSMADERNLQR